MKFKNMMFAAALIAMSTSALATLQTTAQDPKDPGCSDDEYVSEYDATRITQAAHDGQLVIRCFEGKCWDFITKEPYEYEGGEVDNGFYIFAPEQVETVNQ